MSISFGRLALTTLAAVYFLIWVGAAVRASGAGLGCPDWPTCFGQWIPPLSESELPPDYLQRYGGIPFNAVKTWTEYLNRLTGVTIGLLICLTTLKAWSLRRSHPKVFRFAVSTLLMTLFQGWLGAAVVASRLKPFMVTAHMLMALAIVALLLAAIVEQKREYFWRVLLPESAQRLHKAVVWVLLLTLVQVVLGTEVREAVDVVAAELGERQRHLWLTEIPFWFYLHRAFAVLLLVANGVLIHRLLGSFPRNHLGWKLGVVLTVLLLLQLTTGLLLERLAFPPVLQPFHLLGASLIFGVQWFLLLVLSYGSHATTARPSSTRSGTSI